MTPRKDTPDSGFNRQEYAENAKILFDAALERTAKTLEDINQECGYDIRGWLYNRLNFDVRRTSLVCRALGFSNEQAEQFILGVNPDIAEHAPQNWLIHNLVQKNWNHIDYPALDPEWLASQKSGKAGLFIKAHREKALLSQEQVAERARSDVTGFHLRDLSKWETGRAPLPFKHCNALAAALRLNKADTEFLKSLIREEARLRGEKRGL